MDLRPNGLCQHNGLYHIFHQYTPAQDLGLHKSWGHYVTRDWKHFADPGTLMCPDSEIDKDGRFVYIEARGLFGLLFIGAGDDD
ncbi:hypothetical protein [Faecalibaculum rodentium]|uniref:hypothetical protein n=1 Tax=Faecalibaculum rodentium TaxID=1702221 RepID=UPI0026707D80|nr:hypothetical protein [Faecalibaculum rodentium]